MKWRLKASIFVLNNVNNVICNMPIDDNIYIDTNEARRFSNSFVLSESKRYNIDNIEVLTYSNNLYSILVDLNIDFKKYNIDNMDIQTAIYGMRYINNTKTYKFTNKMAEIARRYVSFSLDEKENKSISDFNLTFDDIEQLKYVAAYYGFKISFTRELIEEPKNKTEFLIRCLFVYLLDKNVSAYEYNTYADNVNESNRLTNELLTRYESAKYVYDILEKRKTYIENIRSIYELKEQDYKDKEKKLEDVENDIKEYEDDSIPKDRDLKKIFKNKKIDKIITTYQTFLQLKKFNIDTNGIKALNHFYYYDMNSISYFINLIKVGNKIIQDSLFAVYYKVNYSTKKAVEYIPYISNSNVLAYNNQNEYNIEKNGDEYTFSVNLSDKDVITYNLEIDYVKIVSSLNDIFKTINVSQKTLNVIDGYKFTIPVTIDETNSGVYYIVGNSILKYITKITYSNSIGTFKLGGYRFNIYNGNVTRNSNEFHIDNNTFTITGINGYNGTYKIFNNDIVKEITTISSSNKFTINGIPYTLEKSKTDGIYYIDTSDNTFVLDDEHLLYNIVIKDKEIRYDVPTEDKKYTVIQINDDSFEIKNSTLTIKNDNTFEHNGTKFIINGNNITPTKDDVIFDRLTNNQFNGYVYVINGNIVDVYIKYNLKKGFARAKVEEGISSIIPINSRDNILHSFFVKESYEYTHEDLERMNKSMNIFINFLISKIDEYNKVAEDKLTKVFKINGKLYSIDEVNHQIFLEKYTSKNKVSDIKVYTNSDDTFEIDGIEYKLNKEYRVYTSINNDIPLCKIDLEKEKVSLLLECRMF